MGLTIKINAEVAKKLLNGTIPIKKGNSITIKVADANLILNK
jgi:hypothetical protein